MIERDPEVISSDVDIAARVGQELFLDEKIRRHQSSRRYVRIVEHTVLKEKEASKVFTYQGLTTTDMHGSRQEVDDNEQHIHFLTKKETGE